MTRFFVAMLAAVALSAVPALAAATAPCPPVTQYFLTTVPQNVYVECPATLSDFPGLGCNMPCPDSIGLTRRAFGVQQYCRLQYVPLQQSYATMIPQHRNDKGQCVPSVAAALPSNQTAGNVARPVATMPIALRPPSQHTPAGVQAPPRAVAPRFSAPTLDRGGFAHGGFDRMGSSPMAAPRPPAPASGAHSTPIVH